MVGRIVTARHGRPHVDRSVKITAREYKYWWADYDRAGLAPDQTPRDSLVEIAHASDIVLSSTLPRAIETAARVTPEGMIVPQDAIFVEAPLPPPPVPFLKLTPTTWGVISRSFWYWGFAPEGVESHKMAQERVKLVAQRLIDHAEAGHDVLLCAHGYLNWMIDRHIRKRGWQRVARAGKNEYWSWRAYSPSSGEK